MLYENGAGTEETRRTALRLWALESVRPHHLNMKQIHTGVVGLIPEKFGEDQLYLQSGPPYFDDWVQENINRGYVRKVNPFSYVITEAGIARVRDLENRFLEPDA